MKNIFWLALTMSAAAQVRDFGRQFVGPLDANTATRTRPFRVVSGSLPGSCTSDEWIWSLTASSLYRCSSGSWVALTAGGGGSGVDPQLGVSRVSGTTIRLARGRHANSGTTWTVASHDCTISAGTSTGPWSVSTAQNGTVVLVHPSGLTVACALTSGETLGSGELTVIPTSTAPGTLVTPLASGTITSGAVDTTVVDLRTPINGEVLLGSDGVLVSRSSGVTTFARNPAIVGSIAGATSVTGDWDFSGATTTRPHRAGAGAPSSGACTSGTVGATYVNTSNGGQVSNCLQTGASTYTWVAVPLSGGGGGNVMSTAGQGFQWAPQWTPTFINLGDDYGTTKTNPIYYQFIGTGITASKLVVDIITATGTSTGFVMAVYDAACTTKLAQVTAQTITSGVRATTFTFATPITLAASTAYNLGFAYEATGVTLFETYYGNAQGFNMLNDGTNQRFFKGSNAATGSNTSLSMPSSCGTKSSVGLNGAPIALFLP